jgi:hypothetical protein
VLTVKLAEKKQYMNMQSNITHITWKYFMHAEVPAKPGLLIGFNQEENQSSVVASIAPTAMEHSAKCRHLFVEKRSHFQRVLL